MQKSSSITYTKIAGNTKSLLNSGNDLFVKVKNSNLKKEFYDYLVSLANLEISIFENPKLNTILSNRSLFYEIAKYNIFERLLKLYKESLEFNQSKLVFVLKGELKNILELIYHIDSYHSLKLLQANMAIFAKSEIYYKGLEDKAVDYYNEFVEQYEACNDFNAKYLIGLKIDDYKKIKVSEKILEKEFCIKREELVQKNYVKAKVLSWINLYKE